MSQISSYNLKSQLCPRDVNQMLTSQHKPSFILTKRKDMNGEVFQFLFKDTK